MGACVA